MVKPLAAFALTGLLFAAPPASRAAGPDYPTRTITILAPFGAGSTVDVEARFLAEGLRERLHQPVVVIDVPGGSGGVALDQLEAQPADGYTLLFCTRTISFLLASGQVKWTPADVIGVMRLNGEAAGFFASTSSQYRSLSDFVKYAKANPGKVSIAGPEAVSINHQVEIEFADAAGINVNWVPFASGTEVTAAVLGGHVDGGIAAASNALEQVRSGSMRFLALAAKAPYQPYPDAPTFEKSKYPVVEYVWRGFLAKAGTPPATVGAIVSAVNAIRASPEWADFTKREAQVDLYMNTRDFSAYLAKEVSSTTTLAKRMAAESK
jgi:tripartite-type tricarboxylate transporter receptor subunit TctC